MGYFSDFNNDIFVGGLYRLLSFNEKDIFTLNDEYYLYFTSYSINGESFPFYSHKNMKKEMEKNILDLKYNENIINRNQRLN
ncbi:MAG: hypothetical protein LIO97_06110, partial [Tannerellaceae bacterium]|nr:hypothetical protein [Tannerellaceae bacterium]